MEKLLFFFLFMPTLLLAQDKGVIRLKSKLYHKLLKHQQDSSWVIYLTDSKLSCSFKDTIILIKDVSPIRNEKPNKLVFTVSIRFERGWTNDKFIFYREKNIAILKDLTTKYVQHHDTAGWYKCNKEHFFNSKVEHLSWWTKQFDKTQTFSQLKELPDTIENEIGVFINDNYNNDWSEAKNKYHSFDFSLDYKQYCIDDLINIITKKVFKFDYTPRFGKKYE
jgi:hypothetical protein